MDKLYHQILQYLIIACVFLVSMIVIKHQMPPKIVKVDLMLITSHYTEQMLKDTINNSSTETIKKISNVIRANLEPILNNYAKSHNVIIIQSQAVISGEIEDISAKIIDKLDSKLK